MKTMNCKQLGGTCNLAFQANPFEEIAEKFPTYNGFLIQPNGPSLIRLLPVFEERVREIEPINATL